MLTLAGGYVLGNDGLSPTFVVGKSNPMNLLGRMMVKEHPFMKETLQRTNKQTITQRGPEPL